MQIPTYDSFVHPYNWLLILALSSYIISIVLFETIQNKRYSLNFLFLGSIVFFSYIAITYPFLHTWDEQLHALVAKNLGNHFLTPTLLENPILPFNATGGSWWVDSHIWLHKQPFFLWQMALSMKIFGVNTFALRIPDIIMASIIPLFIYRIGKIIQSKSLGFYAGLLFISSSYLMTLISGKLNTDHNDMAFIFYVTASFWAWFEYSKSGNKAWLIAIGVFSGIAILVKWLVGLIVYAAWGIIILSQKNKRFQLSSYYDLLKSIAITIAIALPWQIYILLQYPIISRFEYAYSSSHLHNALEGHGGNWQYHFQQWNEHIAPYFQHLIPISLILFFFTKIHIRYKIAISAWVIIITLFFTYAATKMPAFTFIISPLFFIILLSFWDKLVSDWSNKSNELMQKYFIPIFRASIMAMAFYFMFNLELLENKPTWRKDKWKENYTEALTFKKIATMNLPENSRFYNFYFHGAVRFMFHTPYQGRSFIPTSEEIEILKSNQVAIYIFDNNQLPDYILKDRSIVKIKSPIWPDYQIEDLEFYK
jgi:4-amino-4-deoxy-L-arabinose transferase